MVPDLLAWQVRSERTYSLSAVPVTGGGGGGGAGPRRLTIYAPGSPSETPTPPEPPHVCGSVVVWEASVEPSNSPATGTSFKTRLFPALHAPSLESLGHVGPVTSLT